METISNNKNQGAPTNYPGAPMISQYDRPSLPGTNTMLSPHFVPRPGFGDRNLYRGQGTGLSGPMSPPYIPPNAYQPANTNMLQNSNIPVRSPQSVGKPLHQVLSVV